MRKRCGLVFPRAGLKRMQPMQLQWAPRLWGPASWCLGRLFILPDTSCAWEFSRKILGIVQKIWAPLGKLFAPPGVPSWLLARMEPQPSRIHWLKVTAHEREDYYHESKNLLDQPQLPTEIRHCQNFNCTDEKHLEKTENLYAELTSALLAAAPSSIKTTGKKNEGKFSISGWNSVVKSKHQIAKAAFRLWVTCNRPKTGGLCRHMTKTKKISNIHCGNAAKMLKCIRPMAQQLHYRLIRPRSHFDKRPITKTDPHHYKHWWEGQMVVQRLLKCGQTIWREQ